MCQCARLAAGKGGPAGEEELTGNRRGRAERVGRYPAPGHGLHVTLRAVRAFTYVSVAERVVGKFRVVSAVTERTLAVIARWFVAGGPAVLGRP